MEKLYYDLSEHEFSTGRKVLLWIFCVLFLLAGMSVVYMHVIQHKLRINISYSIPPFGISLFTGIIAYFSTVKRKNHYFLIDDDKIEYRYGLIRPVLKTHPWKDVKEIHMAHGQKKIRLVYQNEKMKLVNLTWLERKKSNLIRKHIYYIAREKNITLKKVNYL
ncbi:MAG: hypothetical protein ACUVTX_02945 [Bacteroidales bacterium]